jgi:hypothetical protein
MCKPSYAALAKTLFLSEAQSITTHLGAGRGLPTSEQSIDIHDATWGVLSEINCGAAHPSAEGAMADAALPVVASVLQLDAAVPDVSAQAVAPIPLTPARSSASGQSPLAQYERGCPGTPA